MVEGKKQSLVIAVRRGQDRYNTKVILSYKVMEVVNSLSYYPGQELTRDQVERMMSRNDQSLDEIRFVELIIPAPKHVG